MNIRTRILTATVALVFLTGATAAASDTLRVVSAIEAGGRVVLTLPAGLAERLIARQAEQGLDADKTDEEHQQHQAQKQTTHVGYRVQVFDDNNVHSAQHSAQARKQQIESRFPEFKAYIQFNSPYWRVKVGDFRTRSEAEAAMAAIRSAFPAFGPQLRVVRDRINPQ